jgi:uncharacterized membrane protein YesL
MLVAILVGSIFGIVLATFKVPALIVVIGAGGLAALFVWLFSDAYEEEGYEE